MTFTINADKFKVTWEWKQATLQTSVKRLAFTCKLWRQIGTNKKTYFASQLRGTEAIFKVVNSEPRSQIASGKLYEALKRTRTQSLT